MANQIGHCPLCGTYSKDEPYCGSYAEAIASTKERPFGCSWFTSEDRAAWKARQTQAVGSAQGKKVWPDLDDRPLPSYGQIPWKQLGRDVVDVIYAKRRDYEFDPTYYEGHQMVPQINFNSLARIVDKYRYYGQPPAALTPAGSDKPAWRDAMQSVVWWLEGCLKCETWSWDGQQREAAEDAVKAANAVMASHPSTVGEPK